MFLIYLLSTYALVHAGVLSVAAGVMAVHYEMLVETYDACPIPMLVGESETGEYKPNEENTEIIALINRSLQLHVHNLRLMLRFALFFRKVLSSEMCSLLVWPGSVWAPDEDKEYL